MIDKDLLEFRIGQVKELEEGLIGLNDNNHCVVNYGTFVSSYLPELHQLVTNPEYQSQRWVQLTGNMFARLVVLTNDEKQVLYEIPSILGQGYTASPDPEDNSLNDRLVYASNGMDTLPDIAISTRHRMYMDMSTQLEENNYEEIRNNAAKTIAVLNRIFKDHNLSLIEVPEGLGEVVVEEPKKETTTKVEDGGIDLDDCEML